MGRIDLNQVAEVMSAAALRARGWPRTPAGDNVLVGRSPGSNYNIEVWYRPASACGRARWLVILHSNRRLGERRIRPAERYAFHTVDQALLLNRRIQRVIPYDFPGLQVEEATALILSAASGKCC
jgi:hypothetical protein